MLALFKHAKNFVGDGTRPIFEGIYFDGNSAVVTNMRLLVMVENVPSEKRIIHWKTGQLIEGAFPDVSKVIPQKTEINFEIPDIRKWIKTLKISLLISNAVELYTSILECNNGKMSLTTSVKDKKYEAVLPYTIDYDDVKFKVAFNAKYLHDILVFFKDVGVVKMQWGLNKALSPMKLTTNEGVLAILTPIRLKKEAE